MESWFGWMLLAAFLLVVWEHYNDPVELRLPKENHDKNSKLAAKLAIALGDGLFTYADEQTTAHIVDQSLVLCDGSVDRLVKLLQSKFIAGHTPFYWVATTGNPENSEKTPVPPLLSRFLKLSRRRGLSSEVQKDILQALLLTSNDALYQAIKPYLPVTIKQRRSSLFESDEKPNWRVESKPGGGRNYTLRFDIPHFLDRLAIDRMILYDFVSGNSLWQFDMQIPESGNWLFALAEIENSLPWSARSKERRWQRVDIKIMSQENAESVLWHQDFRRLDSIFLPGTFKMVPENLVGLAQFYSSGYVSGPNRMLSGEIEVVFSNDLL